MLLQCKSHDKEKYPKRYPSFLHQYEMNHLVFHLTQLVFHLTQPKEKISHYQVFCLHLSLSKAESKAFSGRLGFMLPVDGNWGVGPSHNWASPSHRIAVS